MVALGVLTQLLRHGIRVPEDIALVGFDDVAEAHQSVVPLTSVRQPGYEIGRAAGAALLAQLADPRLPARDRRSPPSSSSANPPAAADPHHTARTVGA